MLGIDVGSGNVIENKRNDDIMSCYLSDILGNSESILTEYAQIGATIITFLVRFNRQCIALAMPRCWGKEMQLLRMMENWAGTANSWLHPETTFV